MTNRRIAGTPTPIDQYTSSEMFYIAIDNTGGSDELRFSIATGIDPGQEVIPPVVCKDLTTVGGAVSSTMGATGAVAAAGFTLLGLACGN